MRFPQKGSDRPPQDGTAGPAPKAAPRPCRSAAAIRESAANAHLTKPPASLSHKQRGPVAPWARTPIRVPEVEASVRRGLSTWTRRTTAIRGLHTSDDGRSAHLQPRDHRQRRRVDIPGQRAGDRIGTDSGHSAGRPLRRELRHLRQRRRRRGPEPTCGRSQPRVGTEVTSNSAPPGGVRGLRRPGAVAACAISRLGATTEACRKAASPRISQRGRGVGER